MSVLALIISIVALILAYQAYTKSGGSVDELKEKVDELGITTENLRKKTADTISRLEKVVRGQEKKQETDIPSEEPAAEPEKTEHPK